MTTWDIINSLLRLALTGLVIYKLSQFREMANMAERLGLGMMGGGSFLTIGVIIEGHDSPYDGWAATVLTIGMVLLIGGRTWRDMKHQRANSQMIERAKEWQRGRSR